MKIITELVLVVIIFSETISQGLCGNKPGNKKEESKYPSHYNSQVKVDGVVQDWSPESFFCNSATNVYYTASNDSSNIYLCIQVLNQEVQMSLLRSGLTIYLDPFGKKKKNCYLHLTFQSRGIIPSLLEIQRTPGAVEYEHPKGLPNHRVSNEQAPLNDRNAGKNYRQELRLIPIVIETTGFREGLNGVGVPGVGFHRFAACGAIDSTGMLIVEASVPKNAFLKDSAALKYVSFGFEIVGIVTPFLAQNPGLGDRNGQDGQMNGPASGMNGGSPRSSMGGGGFGGGGMRGGDRNNESTGNGPEMGGHEKPPSEVDQQSPKSYKIWYTFSIARKP